MRSLLCIACVLTTAFASFAQTGVPSRLGIGVVAIQNIQEPSTIVTIYEDKGLSTRSHEFDVYKKLTDVRPFGFHPDYSKCQFICLEKTTSYYRILINDTQEGFLKNDGDKHFITWESLLINGFVQRLNPDSNSVYRDPNNKSLPAESNLKVRPAVFEVQEVIEVNGESWIRVQFSKSGNGRCSKQDCDWGWIKWREADKLLVLFLLGC